MSNLNNLVDAIKEGNASEVQQIIDKNSDLIDQYDHTGATPLHYAALLGCQEIVRMLVREGAAINSPDKEFGATPTGWAIEYLRELGGYLGIELEDVRYAIQQGDVRWTARFLQRFPGLKAGTDKNGKSFRELALETGNQEIIALFPPPPPGHPSTP